MQLNATEANHFARRKINVLDNMNKAPHNMSNNNSQFRGKLGEECLLLPMTTD